MAWQLFRLTYELQSPLHIGYCKVGNVQRTRYYIPARNLWAAVTERLTRSGFDPSDVREGEGDYKKIGEWVKDHCAFSYLFIYAEGRLLCPRYGDRGLQCGDLSEAEFERRYLSAHVTTALEASCGASEQGSLHEVELIAPHSRPNGERTKLGGWVFLDDEAQKTFGDEARWRHWLGELQVGGERRYGFGKLRMEKFEAATGMSGYETDLGGDRPRLKVPQGQPLLAHTLTPNVDAKGQIEPLVGRETHPANSASFGHTLTAGVVCWTPGSVLENTQWFRVDEMGLWGQPEPVPAV